MPGPHQIPAAVLPGPHQITGSLLTNRRHRHRRVLVQPQQPGQMHCVLGIGLDPITSRALQLRRGNHFAADTGSGQEPVEPESGRPGLVRHRKRSWKIEQPRTYVFERRGHSRLEQLTRDTIDRCRNDRSCVHIESYDCTLGKHRSLPQLSARPGKGLLVPVTHENL
ncbi:hypothetical protein GCM10022261_12600 [Brevibacterium daeguense]|uniref:Uncharacterized protein n=1 Tax=Brevibacterium daeguense TaxID=909936 RepID=A0ABP8EIF9_9MICO